MRVFSCWNVKIQRSCIAKSKLTKLQTFTQDHFHSVSIVHSKKVTKLSLDKIPKSSMSLSMDSPSIAYCP